MEFQDVPTLTTDTTYILTEGGVREYVPADDDTDDKA